LHFDNLYEVSRKVAAWTRAPDAALRKKFALIQNPKPDSVFSDLTYLNIEPKNGRKKGS